MNKISSSKYLKYFLNLFKKNGISEPYTSLRLILFKTIYFYNKNHTNKNTLMIRNHNKLKDYSKFISSFKKKKIYFNYFQRKTFIKYCLLRLKHIPIQYILKQWIFRNRVFYIDNNILIPRIETERLVELSFDQLNIYLRKLNSEKIQYNFKKQDYKKNKEIIRLKFLEIGIGSGIIFISILKELPIFLKTFLEKNNKKAFIDLKLNSLGIDINENCIEISKINCILHKLIEQEYELENISFENWLENLKLNKNENNICDDNNYKYSNNFNTLDNQ